MPEQWKLRPTIIEYWPDNVDYVMGLDENGGSDINEFLSKIRGGQPINENDKLFTLTGAVFNSDTYRSYIEAITSLKKKYWNDGLCEYKGDLKRVVLHSREIRRKDYPFNYIDYDSFIFDLSELIKQTQMRILSASVNKERLCNKYTKPDHPYHLAVDFILERYCYRLNELNKNGIIILESRGRKREDKFVLSRIKHIVEHGTSENPSSHFSRLLGAYFNPKWSKTQNGQASYVILEMADLVSYPIHKYIRNGQKDAAYLAIEDKFFRYPRHMGWGLKTFPKK